MTNLESALTTFQETLDYRFRDPSLLVQALGAWNLPLSPEAATARQRLEFLGDAAWNFAVAAAALRTWPQATAGDLTRSRATWCSTTGLADLARQLDLPAPPVPDGLTVPAPSERVLAEILEAVLGAVVEDGGLDAVTALAHRVVTQTGNSAAPPPFDPKSALQMRAQARFGTLPTYRLLERRGPPHRPIFRVEAKVDGKGAIIRAEAEGGSRQAAEQDAARLALEKLPEASEP